MTNDIVEIKLEISDEDYPVEDALVIYRERVIDFGDDSEVPINIDHSIKDTESTPKINSILNKTISIGMLEGHKIHQSYAMIDSLSNQELIGRDRWQILNLLNQ